MKNRLAVFLTAVLVLTAAVFTSCYAPSPLYGNWADNEGNKISFISDGTFVASVQNSVTGTTISYDGEYQVIDNVVVFNYKTSEGVSGSMNSEWDLRGSMLYLYWTDSSGQHLLTLYHTSK